MKKIFLLPILLLFIFTSCEKVVDIEVPSIEPKLIIDAVFEIYFDENPVRANTVVKLSKSADYFKEIIPAVTNATVFLTNLSDNSIINFSDTNADGNYKPTISFIPAENITYELTIIHENNTYKGTANRVKSSPLTSVTQGDKTLFSGKETELKVAFTDDKTEDNYYLYDFSNNLFLAIEDRFFNGSDYNFSFFYAEDDIKLPTTVNVKMSGITKEFFTYYRILISQSGQNAGGPFETVPSSLLGNMINITDESKFPLGYFHISETDSVSINLIEKN
ncbi:MAG: DUF4249 domain-containing protein [Flavobacteriia bacterium]|nr:DUF4249 domain-containing protein [Flavobacteriia bacterium]OIP46854.1 MAG: hypothetical protein AUK46_07290 [Flavobacteriaceae bacterium CG2_30_31_66]PIV96349.1 MAG: DUF4249 domain-containing protein [Flavobacteriaceae bacterium CG17_big_fil_post_rev_8_21_14_2_50_31_13]PIX13217.1 MAG: DUF4249 domain-containing protein [Flavobacteriaceae bacterium CG_4_8_14_3_um_filter_31_8]PIY15542.1 MAG: DUF4249 domain-containing protein [Flavobacteriaceae bacterium CG_4_10_14_3_um_filter_31_253]PIZ11725.